MIEQLLKVADAAKMLSVSEKYIYDLAASGELRSFRLGRQKAIRFRPSDIEAFISSHGYKPIKKGRTPK